MMTSNAAAAKEPGTLSGGRDAGEQEALRRHIKAIALYRGLDNSVLQNALDDADDPCHQRVLKTFFGAARFLDDPVFNDDSVAEQLDGAAWNHAQRGDAAGDVRLIYDAMVNVVLDLSIPGLLNGLACVEEEPVEDDNGNVHHAWCAPDVCWAVAKRAVVAMRELHLRCVAN